MAAVAVAADRPGLGAGRTTRPAAAAAFYRSVRNAAGSVVALSTHANTDFVDNPQLTSQGFLLQYG